MNIKDSSGTADGWGHDGHGKADGFGDGRGHGLGYGLGRGTGWGWTNGTGDGFGSDTGYQYMTWDSNGTGKG
jgi:hypothetical protein|tara:strand:- start:2479 stop:2694 length:216 start_codon:yes stop_codon:yes gene_type:complete